MGTQLKFIVDELNTLYPGKNFNMIVFDSITPDKLLQVLSNVISYISKQEDVDLRDESRDQSVKRILSNLFILKYRCSNEIELVEALLLGDKVYILPILEWLLRERTTLEKRAYLAKFLVKIEIPTALRGDTALEELYENYEQLIETFKDAHKEREILSSNSPNTAELRGDLSVMEREREIVATKISSLQKSRIEGSKSATALLNRVQALRETRQKRDTLIEQKARLEASCNDLERFVTRTKQQVTEARRAAQGVTPHGLLQRAEEEKKVSAYIAQEKLPTDLEALQNEVEILKEVISETGLSRTELAKLEQEVRTLSSEVNGLLERRMASSGPAEDKLAPFKQQVAMLGRKKEAAAETLSGLKRESNNLKADLHEIQEQLTETELGSGGALLGEDQFKAYIVQLRSRTEIYKAKRGQLSSLTAECGILSRTIDLLRVKQDIALRMLAAEEARLGLSGFSVTATQLEEASVTKAQLDTQKEKSLENISKTIVELNQIIQSKKAKLAPAIQELRPLRDDYHTMLANYTKVKQQYETTAANLGSIAMKLEQEVKQLEDEIRNAKSQTNLTNERVNVANIQQEMLSKELTLYTSGSGDKSKSLREQLNNKIAEEEKRSRQLKDVQRHMKEQEPANEHQVQLWEGVQRLFQVKLECLERSKSDGGIVKRERGVETLILPP